MNYDDDTKKILTLAVGSSRKPEDRDVFIPPNPAQTAQADVAEPDTPNSVLAGCMAYEALTKGTLFGKECEPKLKPTESVGEHESYGEVASILMSGEAHVPGVVNPTQLAKWIKM